MNLQEADKRELQRRLLAWYEANRRSLPWRRSRSLYRVWISEIMLQQTQVATVIPYYQRFVKRFPSIRELAAADEAEVMRYWEGLGYYRRARSLHAAARQIVAEYGAQFPRKFEEVVRLPGIGRYTAGAILSIALDERLPILEANTIRVLARLSAMRHDAASPRGRWLLWSLAEQLLPSRQCGLFNQALMEVGALICTNDQPKCSQCPLRNRCSATGTDLAHRLPHRSKTKQAKLRVRETAIVLRRRGAVLICQRSPSGRWGGLWDFPRYQVSDCRPARYVTTSDGTKLAVQDKCTLGHVAASIRNDTGLFASGFSPLLSIRHTVTRYQIDLTAYQASATGRLANRNWRWVRLSDLQNKPMHITARRIADHLNS